MTSELRNISVDTMLYLHNDPNGSRKKHRRRLTRCHWTPRFRWFDLSTLAAMDSAYAHLFANFNINDNFMIIHNYL